MKIAVIGAGSMGTAVSILLENNGHEVVIWTKFVDEANMINTFREQKDKLPGVIIPYGISCTTDLESAMKGAELAVIVVPAQTVRENSKNLKNFLKPNTLVACFSKGLEENTGLRLSKVISEELEGVEPIMLSGPCHAEELSRNIPTAYVASSVNNDNAITVQEIFSSQRFRVYTNPDLIGVELGGATKNVIAICAGISDGLGFGDNTKAALMTRGMAEITRLGVSLGAKRETFFGLAGIGDLIVTCTSMHSRNRSAGILIGKGLSVEQTIKEIKMVVEGIPTTKAVYNLSKQYDIEMPITRQAYEVLFNNKNPELAVIELMTRSMKPEIIS
ncbi:MAG: NAD(P)H-dependent glycerol-3-phosphate dehydrogenase [Eubacteriales bacterium]|nr:NAD(P)H-dependent glycerol-3-phosphate dehydrogenase [Eubacteriales bacterium]